MSHQPVLLKEVIEYLEPQPGDNFVDATLGDGGHALEILKKVLPAGRVLGIDWDEETIARFGSLKKQELEGLGLDTGSISSSPTGAWEPEPPQDPEVSRLGGTNGASRSGIESRPFPAGDSGTNLILKQGNFAAMEKIVSEANFKNIKGVLFDLGFRTFHIEESGRGFSFQKDEPLDMRYSAVTALTAREIINVWSQPELERIFKAYGEEKNSRKIAQAIVESRARKKIETTRELAEVIGTADVKVLARIFQALRIAVNGELENIENGLRGAWNVLENGGRMAVISFQSLEDRMVKEFFKSKKGEGVGKILTPKPVTPDIREIESNPKSRSAKLRVIVKG